MKTAIKWKCHPFSALALFLELLTWAWCRSQGDPHSSPACSHDLKSRLVHRGEGAQVWGLQDHKKHKNCRNVSSLAFILELRLIAVARACAERAGLVGWPHRNLLLRERDTDTCKRWHSVKELFGVPGPYLNRSREHKIFEDSGKCWFCLFFSFPMSLISIQIGTRPFLDSAVLRGEVLLLFVG